MKVLVTGGSGTFGTAYITHAIRQGAEVICLSRGEHRQAALMREIDNPALECWIGDVRDRDRLRWAFRSKPDLVIHAAALKRVETCQAHPQEAAKTNIDGTRNVVAEAMLAGVPKVMLISSDKACGSETIYGTTKAAAEALAIGQNAMRGSGPTRISVVRYGNVLGSQGSVLDVIFKARETGMMPVTDVAATRYWWSIDAAVAFVERCIDLMQGGEIWVPKIPSARVIDLVHAIAPGAKFVEIGMRGNEKRHEMMISGAESRYAYDLGDCYVLLPELGQWWSPIAPDVSKKVDDGFVYSSADHPEPVVFEEAG